MTIRAPSGLTMRGAALMVTLISGLTIPFPLQAKELDPNQCAALRVELRQITEAQRERSTPYLQEERKRVKDQMWALKCEEMERRR
ncbi:MAG: hypothetical protein KBB07_09555 [Tepidiphilus sp.]|nr:hypothetical protein [Tepidiphilus sp.]